MTPNNLSGTAPSWHDHNNLSCPLNQQTWTGTAGPYCTCPPYGSAGTTSAKNYCPNCGTKL